jgi:preprotein translocase subunit SecF
MFILKYKSIFLGAIGAITALSVLSIAVFGLSFGIDFKGGALLSVSYQNSRPALDLLEEQTALLGLGEIRMQQSGESGLLVRTPDITGEQKEALKNTLSLGGQAPLREESFSSIGPSIGRELQSKAWIAIGTVTLAILLFITFAFRHVSEPVQSWKYAIIAIVALLHDILVPTGVFALLSESRGAEVDSLFVVALLTILGISINDTIVVFDRVRENLKRVKDTYAKETFEETVGKSLSQTIVRSITTSLTVIFVLVALFIWGPESTKNFALLLIAGMIAGTYSSIFLASPLLVVWERFSRKA